MMPTDFSATVLSMPTLATRRPTRSSMAPRPHRTDGGLDQSLAPRERNTSATCCSMGTVVKLFARSSAGQSASHRAAVANLLLETFKSLQRLLRCEQFSEGRGGRHE